MYAIFNEALFTKLEHGINLEVHRQMNGYRNYGTYLEWNITQP